MDLVPEQFAVYLNINFSYGIYKSGRTGCEQEDLLFKYIK